MSQSGRSSYGKALTLLAVVALAAGLVVWHYQARQQGRASLPEAAVTTVTRPVQSLFSGVAGNVGGAWHFLRHLRQLEQENRRLRALLAAKEAQVDELMEVKLQAERLKELVRLKEELPSRKVTARVIGHSPTSLMQTLMLNVGRRDGVAVDDIVVAAYPSAPTADHPPRNQSAGAAPDEAPVQGGLVGYVYQVAGRTCHVLLLTDRQSGVGARIQPKRARTEGVCKGIGGEDCLLKYLPNDADVREGDTVVSSGQGKFPPGIVIGKVTSVQRNDYDSTLEARVRPYVDFERLEEVQVLLLYRSEGDAP